MDKPESFRTAFMLADSAQAVGGKLYVLGGGWSIAGIIPGQQGQPAHAAPGALCGIVTVPWDRCNEKVPLVMRLLTASGAIVIEIRMDIEAGRPAGSRRGTPVNSPFVVNYGALPLVPGERYEWRWTIDDEDHPDWRLPFDAGPWQGGSAS